MFYAHKKGQGSLKFAKKNDDGDDDEDANDSETVMHMSSACPWGRTPGQPGRL